MECCPGIATYLKVAVGLSLSTSSERKSYSLPHRPHRIFIKGIYGPIDVVFAFLQSCPQYQVFSAIFTCPPHLKQDSCSRFVHLGYSADLEDLFPSRLGSRHLGSSSGEFLNQVGMEHENGVGERRS